MTQVTPIDATDNYANYSAVKIRVSEPKAFISGKSAQNGNFNAVDIAVDKPFMAQYDHEIYNYPQSSEPVSGNIAIINTEQNYYPVAPEAMYTNSIKEEPVEITEDTDNAEIVKNEEQEDETAIVVNDNKEEVKPEAIVVPEPNVTTTEAEKNLIYFHGTEKPVEIVPPEEIVPSVDINVVADKLADKNYDVQAMQMDVITRTALQKPEEAVSYITKPVFSGLINILKKDTSELAKPTEEQVDIRKKIIVNEMVKQKAEQEGKKDVKLPFEVSEEEVNKAMILSDYEQAERNKEYAIYTIAALDKIYINETEKRTGNVLPLTDLPGVADIVDVLKSPNPSTKLVAMESLYYIKRPEYAEELKSIYSMAASDEDENMARIATEMMNAVDKA